MIVLQLYALAERSHVVAEMQLAGGAIAGKNGRVGIHQRLLTMLLSRKTSLINDKAAFRRL
ncbi:Uncharacterised protein [Raoultella ornithinolytica]|nr:Uncharacterised protein [Raoultella ornithinolytica]